MTPRQVEAMLHKKIKLFLDRTSQGRVMHAYREAIACASPQDDVHRLDFVLKKQAFLYKKKCDGGEVVYQLLEQDENETFWVLSGSGWFCDYRDAIDAAIKNHLNNHEPLRVDL